MIAVNKRNYGIDLLRLFSMYLVVLLHVMGVGGVLDSSNGVNWHIGWLLEAFAYCAVDCFALISGFVGYREENSVYNPLKWYLKILPLWVTVFFYNFGATLFMKILGNDIGFGEIVRSAMPVSSSAYWYFSAYVGLCIYIPLLNYAIKYMPKRQELISFGIIFLIFSVYGTFSYYFFGDVFGIDNGYSTVWLICLYGFGAWIKKENLFCNIRKKRIIGIMLAVILLMWSVKIFTPYGGLMFSYTSPTVLGVAILLFAIFKNICVPKLLEKPICSFSVAAFGVYLIHNQKYVSQIFMKDAFVWIADMAPGTYLLFVLGVAFCIFVGCLTIEEVRIFSFKITGISNLIMKIQYLIEKCLEKKFKIK